VQAGVFVDVGLILWPIEVIFRMSRQQWSTSWLLQLSLILEDVDLIMKSVIDLLFFPQVQRSVNTPRDLSIRHEVHVEQFWFIFSFSRVQAYLSSVHFLVTFISVRIKLFLSAFKDCLAVRIFPVMPLLSSPFRLFVDSDRGLGSIIEGLLGAVDAIGVFYEY